jgi:DNA-binding transcriptional LysR family regulator
MVMGCKDWFKRALDAFRGVVRQGETIALLPHSALVDARKDPTLAIRSIQTNPSATNSTGLDLGLTRQVVLVTTRDRLSIPPIQHFCQLVRQLHLSNLDLETADLEKV